MLRPVVKRLRHRTACNSPRVAPSCTLRRTGTYPCSASVRLPLLTPLFLLHGCSANPSYSGIYAPEHKVLGKSLRSKVFHSAELSDGTRDSVLALKIHAVLYMLRRCVVFSWAKPSVTKSSTHPLAFLVLTHMQSCAAGAHMQSFTCFAKARASIHGAAGHRAVVRSCASRSSRKITCSPLHASQMRCLFVGEA